MTEILLIVLIIIVGADFIIKNHKNFVKPKRKKEPDKRELEKAKQKRREFENFMAYTGDKQN